eukprot:Skav231355  [mRNA]  locus=scaffold1586:193949:195527:+ [translate_table: standard]
MGFQWALPLSSALMRLAALPEATLTDLRHQILSRHHSISNVFDRGLGLAVGGKGAANVAKLIYEDFRTNFHEARLWGWYSYGEIKG